MKLLTTDKPARKKKTRGVDSVTEHNGDLLTTLLLKLC